jgi:hypothetical protein
MYEIRAALSFFPIHGLVISPESIVDAGRLRFARRERVPWFPAGYTTVTGRGRGDEKASRGVADCRCWRSTALFAKELCALILGCPSPKPVETASPRLKLMTLAGGEKGFVASRVGVEKGLAGVVAPLGAMLMELPWRS